MPLFIAIVAALICASCTTKLAVRKVDLANAETRAGIPYPLMFSRYEIAVSRQVVSCGAELKLAVRADIKPPTAAPDPKNLYVLDQNSLSSPLKTSDVLVGFLPSGAPSSLNATAEDRSAQVIANVASTAVSIAKLAAIPSVPALPGLAPTRREICSDVVLKALGFSKSQGLALEAATAIVESRTEELKVIQDKVAAMGSNVDEATKSALGRAYSALMGALSDQKAKISALRKSLSEIVHIDTIYWPSHGDLGEETRDLPRAVLQRWMSRPPKDDDFAKSRVQLVLRSLGGEGRDLGKPDDVRPVLGIPIRQPVVGRLSVCREACGGEDPPLADMVGDVLQLGYVYYLPCESRPFSSISCTFTLTDAGRLQSMGSTVKVATAEVFTGALKDVVDKAGEIRDIRSSAAKKQLEAETALLKAQADRDAAAAALETDPLKGDKDAAAALKATTELLNAQRAQIEAEIALAEARGKRP